MRVFIWWSTVSPTYSSYVVLNFLYERAYFSHYFYDVDSLKDPTYIVTILSKDVAGDDIFDIES